MSSPWGKIAPVQTVDFQEIQSEQYAQALQDKEDSKFGKQLAKQLFEHSTINVPDATEKMNDEEPIAASSSSSIQLESQPPDPSAILNAIQGASAFNLDEFCDNDRIIAEMLQTEFDRQHDLELKKLERQANKDSKVCVSFEKYRNVPDALVYDSDEDDDDLPEQQHWDCFETNEKVMNNLPKKGFGYDEDGVMITKHDATLCGVRNAGKVMSFPPEFQTGDAVNLKLSNSVFNHLRIYSQKIKKNKAQDRKENIATAEMGIDEPTRLILFKLVSNQIVSQISGIISTGKEALILHAETDPSIQNDPMIMAKHCAIKIFKTTLNEFKQRDKYIKDDFRFKDRFSKQNSRVIIQMWAEKEMHNLNRMQKIGINCPKVIALKKNVLVMSFIGVDNIAAPKLKHASLTYDELSAAYTEIVDIMYRLYNDANLIHADLSEYNILWYDGKCWLIDVAQSIEPGHPSGLEYLMRDCSNICSFFQRNGLETVQSKEELFSYITEMDSSVHNAAMLEKLHGKGPTISMATAPNYDEIPDTLKPINFPFEYAWQKTQEIKSKNVVVATETAATVAAKECIKVGAN